MSSHLVDEMEQIVNQAIFIKNGSCVLTGPTDQLRNQYQMNLTDMYRQIYA